MSVGFVKEKEVKMKTIELKSGKRIPLMNIKGKDYLQVAYRLVWFREEHPNWSIETEVNRTKDETFSKAIIKDELGRIISTAHKFEDKNGFADHAEKSETGAIGRALALCGYGTQFEPELEEGTERLADSPLVSSGGIHPENPEPGDGHYPDLGYRIPFGKWAKRSLEEVPLDELRSYVLYIQNKAEKEKKPISGQVLDFISRASNHIGAIETAPDPSYDPGFDR